MNVKYMIVAGCLMAYITCPAAFAQDNYPKIETFFGYSLMKAGEYESMDGDYKVVLPPDLSMSIKDINKSNILKKGISASIVYNFTPVVGLEAFFQRNSGNVSSHTMISVYSPPVIVNEVTGAVESRYKAKANRTDMAFLAGPRFTFRNISESLTPFCHALAGTGRHGGSGENGENIFYEGPGTDRYFEHDSISSFSFALGGGLDIPVNDHFAIRAIQADYYMAIHDKFLSESGISSSLGKNYSAISTCLLA